MYEIKGTTGVSAYLFLRNDSMSHVCIATCIFPNNNSINRKRSFPISCYVLRMGNLILKISHKTEPN